MILIWSEDQCDSKAVGQSLGLENREAANFVIRILALVYTDGSLAAGIESRFGHVQIFAAYKPTLSARNEFKGVFWSIRTIRWSEVELSRHLLLYVMMNELL